MSNYELGDIVLLKFPFTHGDTFKKRPALIILDTNDEDIIVCRITSKLYKTVYDVKINDWEKCGLKLPSVIRVHKIATLDKDLVEFKMGKINSKTIKQVKDKINKL